MRTLARTRTLLVLAALPLICAAAPARADDAIFGVRVGYYTDAEEAFVGAEFLARLAPRVYLNPNVEYIFTEGSTYMTFNADFHYDFPSRRSAFFWLGAGLAVIYVDPDGSASSDTDVGANFLGGVGFKSGSVIPYFQVKLIAKDDTEVALAVGLRF